MSTRQPDHDWMRRAGVKEFRHVSPMRRAIQDGNQTVSDAIVKLIAGLFTLVAECLPLLFLFVVGGIVVGSIVLAGSCEKKVSNAVPVPSPHAPRVTGSPHPIPSVAVVRWSYSNNGWYESPADVCGSNGAVPYVRLPRPAGIFLPRLVPYDPNQRNASRDDIVCLTFHPTRWDSGKKPEVMP